MKVKIIKELITKSNGYWEHGDFNMPRTVCFDEADVEKFAELIVKECANYINQRTLDWDADLRWIFNDGSGDMAVDVDDLLNRHFGVEL